MSEKPADLKQPSTESTPGGEETKDPVADLKERIIFLEEKLAEKQIQAGGEAFADLITRSGAKVGIISRNPSVISSMKEIETALRYAEKNLGWKPVELYRQSNPPSGQPANRAPTAPPAGAPAPATPPATAPAAAASGPVEGAPGEPMLVEKMKVTVTEDGKIQLDFIGKGHNFSDAALVKTSEEILKILAPTGAWTAEYLVSGKTYPVNYVIEYHWGRIKPKGDGKARYRDVDAVQLP